MSETVAGNPLERLGTGIPGLDSVLHGGLLPRSVYMLQGRPGCGKTILANQICFHHAAQGGRVLYTTLLAETHERLLQYLSQLEFFELTRVPSQVCYLSAFPTLTEGGLKGLIEMLRREARTRKTTLLVVDGLVTAQERADSDEAFKQFIQELQISANFSGYTVLLLTTAPRESVRPEHTMVDGVIEVSDNRVGRRAERELEVRKFRGSAYLRGGHAFQITQSGLKVYPRLEALYQDPDPDDACELENVSTGMVDLDRLLHGGLRCASSTVIFGPTGSGKTSLGLHFLSASSPAEPGLHFGFYETPTRLLMKARCLGLDLEAKTEQKLARIHWQAPTERMLDDLGYRLLDAVRETRAKRVFVDGVDGLIKAAAIPDRIPHFLSALTNELRSQGVTTIYTAEVPDLFSTTVRLPTEGISALVENVLLLRFVEMRGQLTRMLAVVKLRDNSYDATLREFLITSRGCSLGGPIESGRFPSAGLSQGWARGTAVQRLRRMLQTRGR